jgi:hypothetical protein
MLRRVWLFTLILLLVLSTIAFASWKTVEVVRSKSVPSTGEAVSAGAAEESSQGPGESGLAEPGAVAGTEDGLEPGEEQELEAALLSELDSGGSKETLTEEDIPGEVKAEIADGMYGSQSIQQQSLTSLLKKNQNFFEALAEGKIKLLRVNATFFEPFGWKNISLVYMTVIDNKGNHSNGYMVLWCISGKWRIAFVSQFPSWLGGGKQYQIPSVFEQDLIAEQDKLQTFLSKVAYGRLDYMMVDKVEKPSSKKTILKGRTLSVAGTKFNTKMTLEKTYGLWHITHIEEYTP